jgi:thiol-disulfide isomerase/thioredoxin
VNDNHLAPSPESGQSRRRPKLPFVAAGAALIFVVAIVYGATHAHGLGVGSTGSGPFTSASGGTSTVLPGLQLNGSGAPAPDFQGIVDWENSQPLRLSALRGKVVLVDFWTYSCINCQHTFPYLRKWYRAYKDQGFVLVGVHSPEFEFEKSIPNIRQAIRRYDVEWPVAVDSNMATWTLYSNQYWPADYFIDKDGRVRNVHFGEGEYDTDERIIRALLAEAGHKVGPAGADAGPVPAQQPTAELYAAAGRGFDLPAPQVNQEFDYKDPGPGVAGHRQNNQIYFNGLWKIGTEYAEHSRDSPSGQDYVTIDYQARDAVMVAANKGPSVRVDVTLDNKDIPRSDAGADVRYDQAGRSYIRVDRSDLFSIIKHPGFQKHILKVSPRAAGFRLFTFDFNG